MDLGQLFGDAYKSVSAGATDLLKQGGNAALGYLEGQAVSFISADKAQHEAEFKNMTLSQLNSPGNPNSLGAYISGLAQDPVLKAYGGPLVLGVVGVAVLGYFLLK